MSPATMHRTHVQRAGRALVAYADLARPLMREVMSDRSCIASTRVTMNVLREFGFATAPVVVSLHCFNPAWVRYVHTLGHWPDSAEQDHLPPDAYVVSVGESREEFIAANQRDPLPDGWFGHLVCLATLAGASVLVDLACDQVTRVEHDLLMPASVVRPVPKGWAMGEAWVPAPLPAGGVALYRPRQQYEPFHDAPDWAHGDRLYGALEIKLIREVHARLPLAPPLAGRDI